MASESGSWFPNDTPSVAGTAETMTADPACPKCGHPASWHYANEDCAGIGCGCSNSPIFMLRDALVATCAALVERTAECSRLFEENQALGTENRMQQGELDAAHIRGDALHVENVALRASLAAAQEALEPFAHFWRQWKRQPMRSCGDEIYAIHTGTEYEAELRRSDCKRAAKILDAARVHATPEGASDA